MHEKLKEEMLKKLNIVQQLVIEKAFKLDVIELKILSPMNVVIFNYAEEVFMQDFIMLSPKTNLDDVQIEEFYDRNILVLKDWINILKI
jgi:hypothetical protein